MDQLSTTLAAISDPTRRSILARLRGGPLTVHDLAAPFRISQQAVSKHLAYLERTGLIVKQRRGREHVCTLNPRPIRAVADWSEEYRRFWEEAFGRLNDFLHEQHGTTRQRGKKP